jgi:succinate-semialdehyde dehydrogenase / glutarate-semialdehyde dehydrogenase
MFTSIHPFDQSIIEEFQEMDAVQIQKKLDKSSAAFRDWKKTTFTHRSGLMLKAGSLLRENREKYAHTITLEMGKVISEARAEVDKCAGACQFFAEQSEGFLADEFIVTEARKSLIMYQPTGAILAIMPWNFPFWQVIRFAAPALMAGNVGLLKHAPNVTRCSLLLESIFLEAGFPEGVFQSLVMGNHLVENVIQSDTVQGIALTGSEYAGSSVGALAGKSIKKTVLELGGSDAFIVLADADLENAVKTATKSRMQNAGQSCIAAKRFIVSSRIKDEFVDRFTTSIQQLKQGNPFDESVTTGPMARIDLAETLEKQLTNSIKLGARLVTGGQRSGSNFLPALLDLVTPGMPAFDQETFGPLGSITTASSDEEAIALANMSRYGLGASIWTRDVEKGEKYARAIESGSVFVNTLVRSDVRLPFGGIKKSGFGRELSAVGLREFVNIKSISIY